MFSFFQRPAPAAAPATVVHGVPIGPSHGQAASAAASVSPIAAEQLASDEDNRICRVFLSSTFRDMGPERDEIFRSAVPQLRKELEERDVHFVAVDLRWGITEDGVKGGDVTRLCLREVQRSKYFVGFLKARYGWHQDPSKPTDELFARGIERAAEEFPFVRQCTGQSVTEIEVRLGALVDPAAKRDTSRFYFATDALMAADAGGAGEGPHARARLAALKGEVRAAGLPVASYGSARELALAFLKDMREMTERDYPRRAQRDASPLAMERQLSAVYMRRVQRWFAEEPADLAALDAFAAGSGQEVGVLVGPHGCGKTALLAYWSQRWQQKKAPGDLLVSFFSDGPHHTSLLASFITVVKGEVEAHRAGLPPLELDAGGPALLGRMAAWLPAVAEALGPARLVLAVDDVHELAAASSSDQAAVMWIPLKPPPNLRILVSCSGEAEAVLRGRPLRKLTVTPLGEERRRLVVHQSLMSAGKALEGKMLARVSADKCSSPLFLKIVLEELKHGAVHETLGGLLECLLRCEDVVQLYRECIRRWQDAYGTELARNALCALACSRNGVLTEEEMQIFASVEQPGRPPLKRPAGVKTHTPLQWTEFMHAAEFMFSSKLGLCCFTHASGRTAVKEQYNLIHGSPDFKAWHGHLGLSFKSHAAVKRRAEEAPWHFALAGDAKELAAACSDLEVTTWYVEIGRESEFCGYWTASKQSNEAAALYGAALAAFQGGKGDLARHLSSAGSVLRALGAYGAALPLLDRALRVREELAKGKPDLAIAKGLSELGSLAYQQGDLHTASAFYQRALKIQEEAAGPKSLLVAGTLNNMALLRLVREDYAGAIELYKRCLEAKEAQLGPSHPSLAVTLQNMAVAVGKLRRFDEADALYQRAIDIKEAGGAGPAPGAPPDAALGVLYNGLGALRDDAGRFAEAEAMYKKAVAVWEAALGPTHPNVAIGYANLGYLYKKHAQWPKAEGAYKKALELREAKLGAEHADVADTLSSVAEVYRGQARHADAAAAFERAAAMAEKCAGAPDADSAAWFQAAGECRAALRDFGAAERLLRRALAAAESKGGGGPEGPAAGAALHALGAALLEAGRPEEAAEPLARALVVRRKAGGEGAARATEALLAKCGASAASPAAPSTPAPAAAAVAPPAPASAARYPSTPPGAAPAPASAARPLAYPSTPPVSAPAAPRLSHGSGPLWRTPASEGKGRRRAEADGDLYRDEAVTTSFAGFDLRPAARRALAPALGGLGPASPPGGPLASWVCCAGPLGCAADSDEEGAKAST